MSKRQRINPKLVFQPKEYTSNVDPETVYKDAFEFDAESLEQNVLFGHNPLIGIHYRNNLSLIDERSDFQFLRLNIPLSEVPLSCGREEGNENEAKNNDDQQHQAEIVEGEKVLTLDSTFSSLNREQHRKYQALLQELYFNENKPMGKSKSRKKQEFQILRTLVKEERERYKLALQEFRVAKRDRFLLGFTAKKG